MTFPLRTDQGNRLVKGVIAMRTLEFRTGKYESFGIGYGADSY